ncbi:uncharacterized protein LOC131315646 isoform X1 [Rhododendron vialii]|uniref:uncharacterized protein LOC131315646 isoform X1 n=1 Tax=Rhododendron vialii TaxID=182163 RepID=UPI00265FECA8|nr:uncharacterized protein LOC131315646 isoform X1 [Rhododendron vialii]
MARSSKPSRSKNPSIKYKYSPLEGASFELADFGDEDGIPTSSGKGKQNGGKSEPQSFEMLSTAELISAVGHIWHCASRPLSFLQPKTNLRHDKGDFPQENVLCCTYGKGNVSTCNSAESQYFPVNLMTTNDSSPVVPPNIERLKVSEQISFFEPHRVNYQHSLLWGFMQRSSSIRKEKSPTVGILHDMSSIYGWMSLPGLKQKVNSTLIESKKIDECCLSGDNRTSCCNLGNPAYPPTNDGTGSADSHSQIANYMDSSSGQTTTTVAKASSTSLCSDYYIEALQREEATSSASRTPISRLPADYHLKYSDSNAYEESQPKKDNGDMHVNKNDQLSEFVMADKGKIEVCSPSNNKPHYGLAKQQHAFAGALAGIFVSLCLHPMDTVKTIIQSCRADQKSINYIGRSIISDRGVAGLYRGIASNIASSAPISAVYTFTYESVKGSLLPFLPKEYQSVAHCIGGGCASVATSFIFTPSERIKQQMQVGSHYQNCWNALVGIISKGGLPSLYAGWGAVLCRNVPHSIIKFYTYESLKQLMLPSHDPNAQPNTLQTLVCGGLAGSTAALFTTPFDVVKTRLQTQIPGSIHHYNGVFNTLIDIGKHEGFKGLYRGLIPRLVMYMSQGAIFFASYESCKRLFSMEIPQIHAWTFEYIQNMEDEAP